MHQQLDIAKLVGAASAPVALIIATSIFLSNLSAKYGMLASYFRSASDELRKAEDTNSARCRSLKQQLQLYSGRLRMMMRATFWLTLSIQCFIATVLFTSVSMVFPNSKILSWVTLLFSFAGLVLLSASVVVESIENHRAKSALMLETAEMPGVLHSPKMDKAKKYMIDEHREAA